MSGTRTRWNAHTAKVPRNHYQETRNEGTIEVSLLRHRPKAVIVLLRPGVLWKRYYQDEEVKTSAPGISHQKWIFIPDFHDLKTTNTANLTKMESFLSMYRAHCCSLLDSMVIANFKARPFKAGHPE
ncbi:hypothetical protein V5799_022635 [Amblyomma americanum]|uniref:Uncharacterized protein n=1 Tax=Amblyomma americanum TaxID=6943 RepID=A0AAQ4FK19_AMBAM